MSLISLITDYQISQGRFPLGWLNPWLYGSGYAGFNYFTREITKAAVPRVSLLSRDGIL